MGGRQLREVERRCDSFQANLPKEGFFERKKFESAKKATERCQNDFFVCCLRLSPSLGAKNLAMYLASTPQKIDITMEKQPLEDVSPVKNGDFHSHVSYINFGGAGNII